MSDAPLKIVIEAALLAAGRPLALEDFCALFEDTERPEPAQVRAALDALRVDYEGRGIELMETASGFRVQVRRELAEAVSRLWPERPQRYSRALLETLALIAYRQPITRGEIEAVRGVAVNPNIVKTLLERNWVRVVGTRDVPGHPELLGTTRDFLDYFGLKSLDELPPLSELKAVGDINLQLDLQGEASPPAPAGGEAVPDSAPAAEAAASVDASDDAEASAEEASIEAVADSEPATHLTAAEPQSEEALLEGAGEDAADCDNAVDDEDDEGEEGDELSAEGGDSHELVAAPRGSGD